MLLRTASSNRTHGSCGRVGLWSACILAIAAVNASAQQGGGGMCQGGGAGAGAGAGAGSGTGTASGSAGFSAGGMRGGFGATSSGFNPTASAMQSMQAHANQFRQAQLNAVAANAQLRADTEAMWAAARQRKLQALAVRERVLAARAANKP